jgi:acetylornithine deacetylase/succinyl-diaminopimelate desuccinylase-like protein
MNRIEELAADGQIKAALRSLEQARETTVALAIDIQQVAAPTFQEVARADVVEAYFKQAGLSEVHQDDLNNVYGCLQGRSAANTGSVVISAHLDTVFPMDADLTVKRKGILVYGPGICDNSTGVAGIIVVARLLKEFGIRPPADLWFVANVGEEGLGDLRGMRAVVKRFGREATYLVVEGGLYGQICHQAIAVRRFRLDVAAEGGHSWGSFGNASAIHEMGHMISEISGLQVPEKPKTTFNVGVVEGGSTINSIAQSATMLLDLRSEEVNALSDLEEAIAQIVERSNSRPNRSVRMTLIGDRPPGQIARQAPLVKLAAQALQFTGSARLEYMSGSTDANIPLSQGYAAVCIGLAESGNTHRLDEYLDSSMLPKGLSQLLLLALAVAGR